MKYTQKQFTEELYDRIKQTEQSLGSMLEETTQTYKSKFQKKSQQLESSLDQEGTHPFDPGYQSSLSIGISDEKGELLDLHTIVIWECQRTFLGLPTVKNIPGCKINGELLDETINEIKAEWREYLEDLLKNA